MSWDLSTNLWIRQNLSSPLFNTFNKAVSWIGNGYVWIVLLIILLSFKKTRYIGICIFFALLLSFGLANLIKSLVMRPRPYVAYPYDLLISEPSGSSFPSAHSCTSFALATAYYFSARQKPWRYFRWPLLILAVLIAFSRLYLFVHYPTDVLIGSVLGILCGWIAVKITDSLLKKGMLDFLKIDNDTPH